MSSSSKRPFRLAHLSDIHAGNKSGKRNNAQGVNLREADGYVAFSAMVKDIIQTQVDAVLICGDTFHIPTPETRTVVFVQNTLRNFWRAGIPVYILAGNHDTNDVAADIAASRLLHDPSRRIYSHVEPYVHYELADGINLHMVSHHMYSEQADTMAKVQPRSGEVNIFATHGSVIDPLLKEKLHTEQSPREIVIPDFLLQDKDWSYRLLGHIHERGWVGSKDGVKDTAGLKTYYNGSLFRRGFSDKEAPLGRGWTLWDIETDGTFTPHPQQVAQRKQVDFEVIDASKYSALEVTDLILDRLKKTQYDGTSFNPKLAPMLRQRVVNLDNAKNSAVDHRLIEEQAQHAFSWTLKRIVSKEDILEVKADAVLNDETVEELDLLTAYEKWRDTSTVLQRLSKKQQEIVDKRARLFIEKGEEEMLDE